MNNEPITYYLDLASKHTTGFVSRSVLDHAEWYREYLEQVVDEEDEGLLKTEYAFLVECADRLEKLQAQVNKLEVELASLKWLEEQQKQLGEKGEKGCGD